MNVRVIRAAAGCGKTTALARAYLKLVSSGVEVERLVAITFTRRAAAELVERVGLALRAASGDDDAQAALGPTAPLYLDVAPTDPDVARQALADLGSAPIGTTDHFVNLLLAEFALDAALPLPDDRSIPLDLGLVAVPDLRAQLDASARRLIDPPDRPPPPEVETLTRYFTLSEILQATTRSVEIDGLRAGRCSEILAWLARRIAAVLDDVDWFALFGTEDPRQLVTAIGERTNRGAEWTLEAVALWIANGAVPSDAPAELVPWVRKVHRGRCRDIWNRLKDASFDFGITRVRMDHVVAALRHPYEDPAHLALADDLRESIESLRVQVASDALQTAALQGELSHREMTLAAARIAESPALLGRFHALLVDEIQDASPDQLELYQALARQPGTTSVFVGDGRQSIYLFRGGEPEGLERLTGRSPSVERLLVNHRSTPALVAAHEALFEALRAPMQAAFWTPLESLDGLSAHPANADNGLDPAVHAPYEAPVVLVHPKQGNRSAWQANDDAIHVFWERIQRAWREEGHANDSAAVLCPTWRSARAAARQLRELAGDDQVAWVDGGDGWLDAGIGRDVAFWLRALLDRTDDIAWLALLKHPSVGLSDAALARIRAGVGTRNAQPWHTDLGQVVHAEGLESPHTADDIAAFERVQPAILAALDSIGRDDTSLVLDRLFTELEWRLMLRAGPGGADDVARLEVLLDWIGELDANGTPVDTLSAMLSAESRADVPRVRLERPRRTITCTTVFQSKGLAWDHVAVLSPGRAGRAEPDPEGDTWMDLDGERVRLVGLRFDPEGGLIPFHDPLRRLGQTIRSSRFSEEGARLAYVAVTRARRSVTMGLPNRFFATSPVQRLIAETWSTLEHPAIQHVVPLPPRERHTLPAVQVAGRDTPLPFVTPPVEPLVEQAPSAAAARYSREQREHLAERIASMVQLGGFVPGVDDLPPPRAIRPDFSPADWGTLAHGWFAAWRFKGPVTTDRISAWLVEEWAGTEPEIASWLADISTRLAVRRGPLWTIVTDRQSRLHFEYPLVGRGGPTDHLLLSGRIDLLVARPRGVVVVDFKAGDKSPNDMGTLISGAALKSYGPQLDSYRDALEHMGHRVEAVALWFIRTGASVMW